MPFLMINLLFLACGEKDTDTAELVAEPATEPVSIALEGTWEDNYSTEHTISAFIWHMSSEYGDSSYHVSSFDNEGMWLVAQNDASNTYNPESWSVFDWAVDAEGALYYCQSSYDQATEEEALGAPHADATDLEGGCSTFPWTPLAP